VRKIAANYRLPYYTISPTYSICKNHGYLAGEQYVCPECGEKTEVYSRITGYYRPVQNWNDGKSEEFKERRLYNIGASKLTHQGALPQEKAAAPAAPERADALYLFTTKTCPNCRMARTYMDKAGLRYQLVDAEENRAMVERYGVRQAPTLVSVTKGGVQVVANASNIKKYAETCS
jgi:ribonucleoside-triphosphate reductase